MPPIYYIVATQWELYKSGGMVRVIRIQCGSPARRPPEPTPLPDIDDDDDADDDADDDCPDDPEDAAERYFLHSLPPGIAERFVEHCMVCESCTEALSAADDYISSLRIAGLRLANSGLRLC